MRTANRLVGLLVLPLALGACKGLSPTEGGNQSVDQVVVVDGSLVSKDAGDLAKLGAEIDGRATVFGDFPCSGRNPCAFLFDSDRTRHGWRGHHNLRLVVRDQQGSPRSYHFSVTLRLVEHQTFFDGDEVATLVLPERDVTLVTGDAVSYDFTF